MRVGFGMATSKLEKAFSRVPATADSSLRFGMTSLLILLLGDQLDGTIARDVRSDSSLLFGADLGFHEEWLRDEP